LQPDASVAALMAEARRLCLAAATMQTFIGLVPLDPRR
jgi:hypothetical protein